MDSFSRGSSGRATTELHHMSKKWKDPRSAERSPEHTKIWTEPHSNNVNKQPRKVPVVYYLSRNGNLEHPHFIEVPLSSHDGRLYLQDVIERLNSLRGKGMTTLYSWSSKRSYKNGFVWHDLVENDCIYPAHGQEYVLKGSELFVSSTEQRAPKDLSSADFRKSGGDNDFPEVRRRRNQSWSAVDLHEYKVYTSSGECSVLVAADASTQTEDKHRRHRSTIKEEEEDERINETESSELSRGEISPPPSDSSPETLESLMKADGIVVVTQQEHNLKHNLPTNNNINNDNNNNKMKASSVLMQLISCGSISCGPGGYGKDNPGFSLISRNKSRMLPREGGERNVNVTGDENVVENAVVLRKNRKVKKQQQQQMVVTEDKEYFSGSLIEINKKEVFPAIKRSNSYTGNR